MFVLWFIFLSKKTRELFSSGIFLSEKQGNYVPLAIFLSEKQGNYVPLALFLYEKQGNYVPLALCLSEKQGNYTVQYVQLALFLSEKQGICSSGSLPSWKTRNLFNWFSSFLKNKETMFNWLSFPSIWYSCFLLSGYLNSGKILQIFCGIFARSVPHLGGKFVCQVYKRSYSIISY